MSNPTTPAAALAEQERVLALLDKSAPEPWEIGNFRRYAVFSLHPDASRRPVVTVRHFEGDNEPMDGEAQANLQLCAAAPTLARQYAALLAAHAEALEREARMAAECDMYRVTLQNLHQAAANMLTGIEVNNRQQPDAPARRKDIAGPVVTSLRAAVLSARVALSPNPPTGYAPPPAQAPASAEGGEE